MVKCYDIVEVKAGISRLSAQHARLAAARVRCARARERLETVSHHWWLMPVVHAVAPALWLLMIFTIRGMADVLVVC